MIVFSSGATPACTSVQPTAASASVDTPATSAPRRSWSRMLSLCAAAYNALYSQTLNCGSKSCVLWRVLVDLDGERACYGDCGILSLSISLNHFSSLSFLVSLTCWCSSTFHFCHRVEEHEWSAMYFICVVSIVSFSKIQNMVRQMIPKICGVTDMYAF